MTTIYFSIYPCIHHPNTSNHRPSFPLSPVNASSALLGDLRTAASAENDETLGCWTWQNQVLDDTVDGRNPGFTSWYGKHPIIYKVFFTSKRWLLGISSIKSIIVPNIAIFWANGKLQGDCVIFIQIFRFFNQRPCLHSIGSVFKGHIDVHL